MKTETCKVNQLLSSSMKYIIIFTCINVLLLLQGIYGYTYIAALSQFEGFMLIIIKMTILLVIAFLLFAFSCLLKRNLEIRRKFIHLSVTGFLFLLITILLFEGIASIYIVYQINPQIDMKNNIQNFIELVRPILFVIVQFDLVLFPILMESCRRKHYL